MNWKLRKAFTGNNTTDVQTINGYIAAGEDNDFSVEVSPVGKEYAAPLVVPRTNLIDYSEYVSNNLLVNAPTIIENYAISPEGLQNAFQISTDASAFRRIAKILTGSSGSTSYSMSVFVKKATSAVSTYGGLGMVWQGGTQKVNYIIFDEYNGILSILQDQTSNTTTKVDDVGDYWRFSVSATDTGANTSFEAAYYACLSSTGSTVGTGVKSWVGYGLQLEEGDKATEYIPTNGAAVTRSWDSFSRVQNQVPGICNGIHTHTGAASGGGIAATTLTGTGSGGKFKYEFDTLGKLVLIEADDAGQGYRVDDKLSITTNESHDIEFRLVEGSNATTVTVGMEATKPSKPVPFPVTKMRVADSTDRRVLIMDQRSRYVFPKPTPYLLDSYEGAAAAYSLRRLRSAYTGPAVRVRRESNNDELDIYFDGQGNLDTASLEAFCAGTNGFVKVWYDQGQGGNDAEQIATGAQPKIVSSGSVLTENGLPTVQFIDSTFEVGSTDLYGQTNFDAYIAYSTSDTSYILFGDSTVGGKFSYVINSSETSTALQSGYNETSLYVNGAEVSIDAATTTREDLYNACVLGTMTLEVHQGHTTSSWVDFKISAYSGRKLTGNVSEIILYGSDQSAKRTGIETNINDFYNIY